MQINMTSLVILAVLSNQDIFAFTKCYCIFVIGIHVALRLFGYSDFSLNIQICNLMADFFLYLSLVIKREQDWSGGYLQGKRRQTGAEYCDKILNLPSGDRRLRFIQSFYISYSEEKLL